MILSDLGAAFVSEPLQDLTKLHEIQLEHASLKYPQTKRVVECSPSAFERNLKMKNIEQWND